MFTAELIFRILEQITNVKLYYTSPNHNKNLYSKTGRCIYSTGPLIRNHFVRNYALDF